jgi:predicted DNA-binding transcriptional regulator YafY
VSPGLIPHLQSVLGDAILQSDELSAPADEDGWITLTLLFEYLEQARSRLLGFGRAVEILEPHALRMSLKDYADQVVDFYKGLDRDS